MNMATDNARFTHVNIWTFINKFVRIHHVGSFESAMNSRMYMKIVKRAVKNSVLYNGAFYYDIPYKEPNRVWKENLYQLPAAGSAHRHSPPAILF